MTDIRIRDCEPDGLKVKFEGDFIFNTWKEAFDFIIAVEKAYGWQGEVEIRESTFKMETKK
jgi:hypothetical protein